MRRKRHGDNRIVCWLLPAFTPSMPQSTEAYVTWQGSNCHHAVTRAVPNELPDCTITHCACTHNITQQFYSYSGASCDYWLGGNFRQIAACVRVFYYRSCTLQMPVTPCSVIPNGALAKLNKLKVFFGKHGPHYIIIYSFPLMNFGLIGTWEMPWHEPAAEVSFQLSIQPFTEAARPTSCHLCSHPF